MKVWCNHGYCKGLYFSYFLGMPNPGKLEPKLDPSKKGQPKPWYVGIPARLSPTGKFSRKYFPNYDEAKAFSKQRHSLERASERAVREAGPDLIKAAVNYDELFRTLYDIPGGFIEACEAYMKELDQRKQSKSFGCLVQSYEDDHYESWAEGTKSTWRTHRNHFKKLEERPAAALTTQFWRDWLKLKSKELNWSDNTVNGIRGRASTIYVHGMPDSVQVNPLEPIKPRKLPSTVVAVYEVEQIRALLNAAWEHDRGLVPYFAIAIFAGLRPESELMRLDWRNVDFEARHIQVNFDNKTQTKRFVPIQPHLLKWLSPWRNASGPVASNIVNFTRRRRCLTRGKYQSPKGVPEKEWKELVPYGHDAVHDICRHTFGSYMDVVTDHDRDKIKEWMGHADYHTYDQHYRNARTKEQGAEFIRIYPPD